MTSPLKLPDQSEGRLHELHNRDVGEAPRRGRLRRDDARLAQLLQVIDAVNTLREEAKEQSVRPCACWLLHDMREAQVVAVLALGARPAFVLKPTL